MTTKILDDNARKFVTKGLPPEFIEEHIVTSYVLITDWLETDADTETKITQRTFDSGDFQIHKITKTTKNGKRSSVKEDIDEDMYNVLVTKSKVRVVKKRYELEYPQDDITFDLKYDEFADSSLRIIEVDADNDKERNVFMPEVFPTELNEVTGDTRYYGYRVAYLV